MLWFKVFADGTELDIVCAINSTDAIRIAKTKFGGNESTVWSYRPY